MAQRRLLLTTILDHSKGDGSRDGRVQLLTPWGDDIQLELIIKHQLRPSLIPTLEKRGPGTLVVSRYVTPSIGRQLRQLDMGYADTAGNMFLDLPHLLIDIEGRRPQPDRAADRAASPGLTVKTMSVYLILLSDPELINAPLRYLAWLSGVSLGTVQKVVKSLPERDDQNWSKTRHDDHWKSLAHNWVSAYITRHRFTQQIETYQTHMSPQEVLRALPPEAVVSGEAASFIAGADIRPSAIEIYSTLRGPLIKAGHLRRSADGWVTVRRPMWSEEPEVISQLMGRVDGIRLAPPLLRYADLVANPDPRLTAVAMWEVDRDPILRSLLS